MNFVFAMLAVVVALAPAAASATATALAYVQDERTAQPAPPAATDPIQATMSATAPGQSAFAFANQSTGTLRVSGDSGDAYPYVTTSNASASFSDVVTFSGGVGLTAYLDYSFDGTLTNAGSPQFAAAFGQLQAHVANVGGAVTRYETLSGYAANCGFGTNCEVGTSTARTGSLAFMIFDGATNVNASLQAFASYGNSFDFANTAKFYLRTPDGVTFSSANGFLSEAVAIGSVPVTPVPEPETYALMLAGLSMLGLVARRRRSVVKA